MLNKENVTIDYLIRVCQYQKQVDYKDVMLKSIGAFLIN